ncbi:MAG: hypothetical protein N3G20_01770, partial [Verrucomicrobiae bacterium]|nr:hypothetical protein [Verrucomicrobiae bacterium]
MSRRFAFDLAFVGALCGSVCLGEQGTSTIENVLRQEQADAPVVLLLEGAAGAPEYKANFHRQVDLWSNVARVASAILIKIPDTNCIGRSDLDQFRASLNGVRSDGAAALWLVMIGHGTFDGSEAKFNLRGPDLSATELAELLRRFTRPVVVINTASASGGFLGKLSGTNRVVVTATRSGHEQNFARFGLYLACLLYTS